GGNFPEKRYCENLKGGWATVSQGLFDRRSKTEMSLTMRCRDQTTSFCHSALLNPTPRSDFSEESQVMRYIAGVIRSCGMCDRRMHQKGIVILLSFLVLFSSNNRPFMGKALL